MWFCWNQYSTAKTHLPALRSRNGKGADRKQAALRRHQLKADLAGFVDPATRMKREPEELGCVRRVAIERDGRTIFELATRHRLLTPARSARAGRFLCSRFVVSARHSARAILIALTTLRTCDLGLAICPASQENGARQQVRSERFDEALRGDRTGDIGAGHFGSRPVYIGCTFSAPHNRGII